MYLLYNCCFIIARSSHEFIYNRIFINNYYQAIWRPYSRAILLQSADRAHFFPLNLALSLSVSVSWAPRQWRSQAGAIGN